VQPGERLPAVLALRWSLPPGLAIVGLVTDFPIVCARYAAPPSWSRWTVLD